SGPLEDLVERPDVAGPAPCGLVDDHPSHVAQRDVAVVRAVADPRERLVRADPVGAHEGALRLLDPAAGPGGGLDVVPRPLVRERRDPGGHVDDVAHELDDLTAVALAAALAEEDEVLLPAVRVHDAVHARERLAGLPGLPEDGTDPLAVVGVL